MAKFLFALTQILRLHLGGANKSDEWLLRSNEGSTNCERFQTPLSRISGAQTSKGGRAGQGKARGEHIMYVCGSVVSRHKCGVKLHGLSHKGLRLWNQLGILVALSWSFLN